MVRPCQDSGHRDPQRDRKMSLKTSPAPTAKEFSASKNIKSMRALFQEDVTVDKNGMRHRSLSSGATAKELPKNAVGEEVEP